MGFDVANVGAFLGGANQGVGQGMDLYAKYDEMRTKNEQKQKQRSMEQKIAELAPMFKIDPVGAAKLAGEHAATMGDFDTYRKFSATAEEIGKADQLKSGMNAFTASLVSPTDTAKHLNDWAKKGNMPLQFNAVNNTDGSFTMLGMGQDPKVGKRYSSLQDLHDDTLTLLAPTMLGPEKMMEFETERGLKQAQTGLVGAQTEGAEADTAGQLETNKFIAPKAQADIDQSKAGAALSRSGAAVNQQQAIDLQSMRPGKLLGQEADILTKQEALRTAQDTHGSRVSEAITGANAARRQEMEAQMTQPARLEGVEADLVGKRADAAKAEVEAANAAPNAALTQEERRANIRQSDAAAAAQKSKPGERTDQIIKPYVMTNDLDSEYVPPRYGDQANLAQVANAAEGDGLDQSVVVGRAVEALRDTGAKKWDRKNGIITLSNGTQLHVGPSALATVKSIVDRTANKSGAASAGIGG